MLVTELPINKNVKAIGAYIEHAFKDPHSSDFLLVRPDVGSESPNSIKHYRIHKNLWKFIQYHKNKSLVEYYTAVYVGISRVTGLPLLKYPHGIMQITEYCGTPRLEILNSLEDHTSIRKPYSQSVEEIEIPENKINEKLLLIL